MAKRSRGAEHTETVEALNNLGRLYEKIGDYAKAEPLHKEALEICQKVLGREDPDTALSLNNLAVLYWIWATMPKPNRCTKRLWRFARKSLAGSIPIRHQA